MKLRNVFVYTHDSIGLGEDGPTHQPVEQLASLRVTPNMSTWRPCDQVESAVAWQYGIERNDGPTTLVFSRQNLTQQPRTAEQLANVYRGGYVLKDCAGTPDVILIATGSEVGITVEAADKLTAAGRKVRVVSMPSTDAFDNHRGQRGGEGAGAAEVSGLAQADKKAGHHDRLFLWAEIALTTRHWRFRRRATGRKPPPATAPAA